jgi:transposase
MEREVLEKYLQDGFSLNQISKETGKSLTTIRYWKDKYQLKSKYNTIRFLE